MSEQLPANHISKQRVKYVRPEMDKVQVERGITYAVRNGSPLTLDVFYPGRRSVGGDAAVIMVTGYPDAGARRMLGCCFKDMGAFVSWAELIAASGMIAIAYENESPRDAQVVLDYVRGNGEALGIDPRRVGVWSCSGHGPTALSLIANEGRQFACAALLYPYTIDRTGRTDVSDAAARFRFATAVCSFERLPADVPLLVVRAGGDEMPGLNAALDGFVADAFARNLSITAVNHSAAPHGFDISDASPASQRLVRRTLAFLADQLDIATPA